MIEFIGGSLLFSYPLLAIFVGAFFFGETVIISAAVLAGQHSIALFDVFWISLVATIISDAMWFLFGNIIFKYINKHAEKKKQYNNFIKKLELLTGHRPFLSLLFIKFLYGTRILTIIYLSIRKIGFWKFILFDTIGTFLWLIVMILIGWLAGVGVINLIPAFNSIGYILMVIFFVLILVRYMSIWLEKKVIKE